MWQHTHTRNFRTAGYEHTHLPINNGRNGSELRNLRRNSENIRRDFWWGKNRGGLIGKKESRGAEGRGKRRENWERSVLSCAPCTLESVTPESGRPEEKTGNKGTVQVHPKF